MRRCDRKLIPVLDSWSAVDVVITQSELLYFATVDIDNEMEGQVTTVSKGVKGLPLSQVAVGRKIVGRFMLSEITTVQVIRVLPNEKQGNSVIVDVGIQQTNQTRRGSGQHAGRRGSMFAGKGDPVASERPGRRGSMFAGNKGDQ